MANQILKLEHGEDSGLVSGWIEAQEQGEEIAMVMEAGNNLWAALWLTEAPFFSPLMPIHRVPFFFFAREILEDFIGIEVKKDSNSFEWFGEKSSQPRDCKAHG